LESRLLRLANGLGFGIITGVFVVEHPLERRVSDT